MYRFILVLILAHQVGGYSRSVVLNNARIHWKLEMKLNTTTDEFEYTVIALERTQINARSFRAERLAKNILDRCVRTMMGLSPARGGVLELEENERDLYGNECHLTGEVG